jgi:ribosomal protein S3AE
MAAAKKKKRFFNIGMPLIKRTTQLQAYEISGLDNRYIKYDLTRLFKGKSMILTLKTKVEGDEVTTVPKELRLMPFYLKRMVRRGTNYIEDSFSTPAKDATVRIKPFLVTRRKVSRAVRKALRSEANKELADWAKENNSEDLFQDVLKNKVQRDLSVKLKKIYPLALCEIRVLKVEN